MLPAPQTNRFRPYLFTGERLLWTGKPKQGLMLVGRDALMIPVSLVWGGFAIFWNFGVWTMGPDGDGAPWFFRLWGLPFLVVGLYLIVGRFIHDAAIRRRLDYAVSDQRVLTLRGARNARLTAIDIDRLPRLEMTEYGDGTGTIAFEADETFGLGYRGGFGLWVPSLANAAAFLRIDRPRQVYELVRDQSRASRTA